MLRILTVCTANICRSPVAHLLLQTRVPDAAVSSAGTRALVGESMDRRSLEALAERGLEGTTFRASALTGQRIADADLVLTATAAHRDQAVRLNPRALKRTFTLLEFALLAPRVEAVTAAELITGVARHRAQLDGPADIADPVSVDAAGYRRVMETIDDTVARIADLLNRLDG